MTDHDEFERLVDSNFGLNQTLLRSLCNETQRAERKDRYYFFLTGTTRLSMVASILAAFEKSMPDLKIRQTLSISLIGAGGMENEGLRVFEQLLHLLPAFQTLNLMSISPGSKMSPSAFSDGKGDIIECQNCQECTSSNKKRLWGIYGGLYQNYAKTSYYRKLDLAVLFYSGRVESAVDDWAPTAKFLIDSGTLTLCTTWTKREAKEEEIELDQLGARFITRPEENK